MEHFANVFKLWPYWEILPVPSRNNFLSSAPFSWLFITATSFQDLYVFPNIFTQRYPFIDIAISGRKCPLEPSFLLAAPSSSPHPKIALRRSQYVIRDTTLCLCYYDFFVSERKQWSHLTVPFIESDKWQGCFSCYFLEFILSAMGQPAGFPEKGRTYVSQPAFR